MRELHKVKLQDLIVHILDTEEGLEVSDVPIPAESDRKIFDYFEHHIQASLRDSGTRTAKFQSLADEPATTCQDLIEGGNLVTGSQRLATRLFEIMKQDARISPGDLAVCTFKAENDQGHQSFLGIMKIDPTTALRQKRDEDAQGRLFITFEVVSEMLPTVGEKLQKGAFIQSFKPRNDYDMLLVEHQKRIPVGPRVAHFFSQGFLNAAEALTPEESTRHFVRQTKVLRELLERELQPEEDARFEKAVEGAQSSKEVNLDKWVENLELPEPAKKKVAGKLNPKRFPNRRVPIVQGVVEAERQRGRVFRGDFGLRLQVPADFPSGQVQTRKTQAPGKFGGRDYYVITIESETWKEQT